MANISGTYNSPYGSPQINTTISYSQTARTATSVTYHWNISAYMASGYFGYTLGWQLVINGQTFTGTLGSGSHNGPYTWSTTADTVVSCGAGGGTLNAEYWTTRPGAEGNSGKVDTGVQTVNVSSFETNPTWNTGDCTVTPNGYVPETVSTLSVSWPSVTCSPGYSANYVVTRFCNNSSDGTVYSGTATSFSDDIGQWNNGNTYMYQVQANDGNLWATSNKNSQNVYINNLTGARPTTSYNFVYVSSNTTFQVTWSGASNTNGDTTFTYRLTANSTNGPGASVPLYNCDNVTSPCTITIYVSGTLPTGPYMKFSELASAYSNYNYQGNLQFYLYTTNAYGTTDIKTYSGASVDLRTNPTAFSVSTIGGYYTINTPTATNYFIPDRKNVTLSWNPSTDLLGGTIKYDVQASLGGGSYSYIAQNVNAVTLSTVLSKVSSRTTCVFKVIAKTSYNYTATATSSQIYLDYYNVPSVSFNPVVRTTTQATVSGTVSINTSIPNVTLSSSTYVGKAGTSQSLTVTSGSFNQVDPTTLVDSDTYTFTVTVQDIAGVVIGTAATPASITVNRYTPMFSIRELGVGVNFIPDGSAKLIVGGDAKINGNITLTGVINLPAVGTNVVIQGTNSGVSWIDSYLNVHMNANYGSWSIFSKDGNGTSYQPLQVYGYGSSTPNKVTTQNNTLDDGSGNIILPNGGQFFNSYYQGNKSQFKANWTSANYWGIGANGSANTVQFGSVDSTGAFLNNAVLNLTVDGTINPKNVPIVSTITSATSGAINVQDAGVGTSGFATALHMSTVMNSGYRQHLSIGDYRTGSGWSGGCFIGLGGNDNYPTNYWLLDYGGTLHYKDNSNNESNITFGSNTVTYGTSYAQRFAGSVNSNDQWYMGTGNCRTDTTGGEIRFYISAVGSADYGLHITSDGGFTIVNNNSTNAYITGAGAIHGTSKSAITNTIDYGTVVTYSDESPNHVFNDRGRGQLDANGQCIIMIDPILLETVNTTNGNYNVQLTGIKSSNVYINDLQEDHFVVNGDPNKEFFWEITAERLGWEGLRWNDADAEI